MKTVTFEDYKGRVLRAVRLIHQNLGEEIDWVSVARAAHFSAHHFHRIFRGMTGEAPGVYIRRIRLERAAYQLRATATSVTVVAFDAGFETHEAFTRAFHAWFGEAPAAYRANPHPAGPRPVPTVLHFHPESLPEDFIPVNSGGSTMEITIEKLPPMRMAFMRHTGPSPDCGPTVEKMRRWARERGLETPDATFLGVSHDYVRYDAGVVVGEDFRLAADDREQGVELKTIPAGEYAKAVHRGPFERLGETYAEICGQWAPRSGRDLGDEPCLEFPRVGPESGADPEEWVMDVLVNLKS